MVENELDEALVKQIRGIKPCPFCGGVPLILLVSDNRYIENENNWVVECRDMGCIFYRSSPNRSLGVLIKEWNKRASK